MNQAGNVDPTPASRTFTVKTAAVSVSGSILEVTAAAGAKDNLAITHPSPSTLRVTDLAAAAYTGSGVHTGTGCSLSERPHCELQRLGNHPDSGLLRR